MGTAGQGDKAGMRGLRNTPPVAPHRRPLARQRVVQATRVNHGAHPLAVSAHACMAPTSELAIRPKNQAPLF